MDSTTISTPQLNSSISVGSSHHGTTELQRRQELALLSQQELIELIIRREFPPSSTSATASSTAQGSSPIAHAGTKHPHSPVHDPDELTDGHRSEQVHKRHKTHQSEQPSNRLDDTDATVMMNDIESNPLSISSIAPDSYNKHQKKQPPHNNQSKRVKQPNNTAHQNSSTGNPPSKKSKNKLDFNTVHLRHVAFKLMYIGTDYLGFAIQPNAPGRTVEGELMRALETTCLISHPDAVRLTRCGRTDRGVHACGQVVAVQVRTRLTSGLGLLPKGWDVRVERAKVAAAKQLELEQSEQSSTSMCEDEGDELWEKQAFLQPHTDKDSMCSRCGIPGIGYANDSTCDYHEPELDYARMLNSVLSPTIRIISWQPVSPAFNARFSCTARTYRYFFYADDLDLDRMRTEAQRLIGSHDFRNFCKVDPTLNTHFLRFITNIEVRSCDQIPEDCVQLTSPWPCSQQQWFEDAKNRDGRIIHPTNAPPPTTSTHATASTIAPSSSRLHPDTFCELLIHGNAFLYHQVRCIAGILFLVGRGVEVPDLVERLLDIERTPNKPNYDMAPESPLVLYDTWFPALPPTPGFDYQPTPASNPTHATSFVEQGGAETAMNVNRINDAISTATVDPSTAISSSTASSSSPSPFAVSSILCLYPDAATSFRNEELVFAQLHHGWREFQMQSKVYELFVNQAARNLQAVRNQLQRFSNQSWKTSKIKTTLKQHLLTADRTFHPIRQYSPLLDATLTCRTIGLRPYAMNPPPYSTIFTRSLDPSYDEKVAALKNKNNSKKLERHAMVKTMSEKFHKTSSYEPEMKKVE